MTTPEFNRPSGTERHEGEFVAINVNDAQKIAELLNDRKTTSRTYLAIDGTVLPPPVMGMKFELNPEGEDVEGRSTSAETPPSIYATISLPETNMYLLEKALEQIVPDFEKQEINAVLTRQNTENYITVYDLDIQDSPTMHITSWQHGISIRAFAGKDTAASYASLQHFYKATTGILDSVTSHFPFDGNSDVTYEINLRMPAEEQVSMEVEAEKEWLPQHSYGSFDEVGGLFHAKERLKDIGLAWQYPELAKEYGVQISHFILAGPPGTGKTTLINAFANEFDALVINVKSSEIVNSYLGKSAENLANIIADAVQQASERKVVLLFDEIDSFIGKNTSQHKEYIQTINTFKQELDALRHTPDADNLILAGATNADADDLDPAIVRSGRLELIAAPTPNSGERVEIWSKLIFPSGEVQSSIDQLITDSYTSVTPSKFGSDISIQRLAELTDGKTGADFKEIIARVSRVKFRRIAGLIATRKLIDTDAQQRQITQAELEEAVKQFGII